MKPYLPNKTPRAETRGNQTVTRRTIQGQRLAPLVLLSAEFSVSDDFLATFRLGRDSANGRLGVIESAYCVDGSITPDVRPKFSECESRVFFDHALAQVRPELSRLTLLRGTRAQVQVADGRSNLFRECFSLGRGRFEEVGFEVHAPMIDQIDLVEQIFLNVDQNDRWAYRGSYENC